MPMAMLFVPAALAAGEPGAPDAPPMATLDSAVACAFEPAAVLCSPMASALLPRAVAKAVPVMVIAFKVDAPVPTAVLLTPADRAPTPAAKEFPPEAIVFVPSAVALEPLAVLCMPTAVSA
jgi:hypothetical protein